MNVSITEQQLKRNAKALRSAHPELKQQEALDRAAIQAGFQGYAHFKRVEPWLSCYGEDEARGAPKGIDRAHETMAPMPNGYLVFPRDPANCHTIRAVDGELIEHFMWDSLEWAEDPSVVMGAILGFFMRGFDQRAIETSNYEFTAKGRTDYRHELRDIDGLYAIKVANGHGWIAFDAYPEEVCFYDGDARTLLKVWRADAWQAEPLSVMGEIMHAIKRGISR